MPARVYANGYTFPDGVAEVVDHANAVLDATPDNEWWDHTPLQVLALAFPDWEVTPDTAEKANPVLMRHRTVADQWMVVTGTGGGGLLPGRGSTMGQFFRFKPYNNEFVIGTPDQILDRLLRKRHPDAHRQSAWWLLDAFTAFYPQPHPAFTFDIDTRAPMWRLLTNADRHLADLRSTGMPPTTAEVFTHVFPGWELMGLHENADHPDSDHETRALLRDSTHPDRWVFLKSNSGAFLTVQHGRWEPPTESAVFRAYDKSFPHVRGTLGTTQTLLDRYRHDQEHWPKTSTDLWWVLSRFAQTHPDPAVAYACRNEYLAPLMLMGLDGTPDDDKVFTTLKDFSPFPVNLPA